MKIRTPLIFLSALCLLGGCATQRAPMAQDPIEGFNRAMFAVNEGLDTAVLKPVAQGYEAAIPLPARMGIGNVFDNFRDLSRGGNALLQGKGKEGMTGFARILINSTLGLLGLFDVASEMGLEKGDEDFGQTLAVWGAPAGPYLYLPLFGPSGGRDIVGFGVDQYMNPLWYLTKDHIAERNTLHGLRMVHYRAVLLSADRIFEEATWDKYAYLRGAYLQRRAAQIRDGRPAPVAEDDDDDPETQK